MMHTNYEFRLGACKLLDFIYTYYINTQYVKLNFGDYILSNFFFFTYFG